MQLFKTEMIFLHPPRTRPIYGARAKRALRYGGRLPARTDPLTLPRLRNIETDAGAHRNAISRQPPFGVEWAA
jgi:hypothetical protein